MRVRARVWDTHGPAPSGRTHLITNLRTTNPKHHFPLTLTLTVTITVSATLTVTPTVTLNPKP